MQTQLSIIHQHVVVGHRNHPCSIENYQLVTKLKKEGPSIYAMDNDEMKSSQDTPVG